MSVIILAPRAFDGGEEALGMRMLPLSGAKTLVVKARKVDVR